MPWIPSRRLTFLLQVLVVMVAMAFALYLQHVEHLEPCPLCVFQRVAVIAFGVAALLGWLFARSQLMARLCAALELLAATGGIIVAGRHVWLQHLPPDQVPACGPGLDFWIAALPWQEVLRQVFHGSGECARIDWALLGVSLPGWVLLLCLGLFASALWQLCRRA